MVRISNYIFFIIIKGTNEILLIRSNGDIDILSTGQTIMDSYLYSSYNTKELLTGFDVGKYKFDEKVEILMSTCSGLLFSLIPRPEIPNKNKPALDNKSIMVFFLK